MGIGLLLKKEGISNVRKLDTMNINKIASFISEKICQSFPELHLSQSELFIQISRLDMFIASMDDNASAKYVYGIWCARSYFRATGICTNSACRSWHCDEVLPDRHFHRHRHGGWLYSDCRI